MKLILVFLLQLGGLQFVFAQASGNFNCLQLEGIHIGCVSSVDHGCFRNRAVDNPKAQCNYVGGPSTSLRVEGPIAFHCKSSTSTKVCTKNTGTDSKGETCVTTSECVEYQPPSCQETCVPCYDQVVAANIGLERGCIVCTRKYCGDEPPAELACPPSYNGMPNGIGQKCSSPQHCPTTAIDPLGHSHPVTITTGSCNPPQLPPPATGAPKYCPWKVDKRTHDGCEPIDPDNVNP